MFLFFCAFITNKYLKLSIWKPKLFKTKQLPKKQTGKKASFHFSPKKTNSTEKPFKNQKPSTTTIQKNKKPKRNVTRRVPAPERKGNITTGHKSTSMLLNELFQPTIFLLQSQL
jgi:hypothetical protein